LYLAKEGVNFRVQYSNR